MSTTSYRDFLITWALTVVAAAVIGGSILARFAGVFVSSPYAALLYAAVWLVPAAVPIASTGLLSGSRPTLQKCLVAFTLVFLSFIATYRVLMLLIGLIPGLLSRFGGGFPGASFLIAFPVVVFASGVAAGVAQFMCNLYGTPGGPAAQRKDLGILILVLASSWVGTSFLVYDHVGVIGAARSVGGPAAEIAVFMTVTAVLLIVAGLASLGAVGQYLGREVLKDTEEGGT